MATDNGKDRGSRVVSTYLPANLADALAAKARAEDRTISQVIPRRTLRTAMSDDASGAQPSEELGARS